METQAKPWEQTEEARFARVWRRVAPEEREFCPIVPAEAPEDAAKGDAPSPGRHPLAPFLRQQVTAELAARQAYLALARQGHGWAEAFAARGLLRARRLSAAYFLLTGIQFLPREQARPCCPGRAGLEECLRAEGQARERYHQGALAAREDAALRALFQELARESAAREAQLRQRLEG